MQKIYLPLFAFPLVIACSPREESRPVTDLSEFPNTIFVPTLEHPLSSDKNAVYCATLLYAWDEVKSMIGSQVRVDSSYHDLYLLNKSTSYVNTLTQDEFSSGAEINGDIVTAWAKFRKLLPFEMPLTSFNDRLNFDHQKVASFGNFGEPPLGAEVIKILYYKNDDEFLLTLLPQDKDHEILLYMAPNNFSSLSAAVNAVKAKRKAGEKELRDERMKWKYHLSYEDVVIIPKIDFNIETHYPSLEGSPLASASSNYKVRNTWQRIEFTFDERGAKVESEVAIASDSSAVEERPKPKKMRFDKPFLLMLKRANAQNPYFCLWVANSELMQKITNEKVETAP